MQNETQNPAANWSFAPDSSSLESLRAVERPAIGWLRSIRESSGVSAGELGRRLGVSRQLPLQFERAEAADTITLKSLRAVAAALGCDLVYALVPREGAPQFQPLSGNSEVVFAEKPAGARAAKSRMKLRETAPAPPNSIANPHFCD